jgi:membrane-bound metal-dependent hydrolase YbcI (DUF457 family)
MTGRGHALVGLGVGLAAAGLARELGYFPVVSFVGAVAGSTAPDWLELPSKPSFFGHGGSRVIPHRTLTHWWPLWVLALIVAVHLSIPLAAAWLLGFSLGGLSHILVDLPNPMGVPIWTPAASSRRSLKLWRSGQREFLIIAVFWLLGYQVFRLALNF